MKMQGSKAVKTSKAFDAARKIFGALNDIELMQANPGTTAASKAAYEHVVAARINFRLSAE